MLASHREPQQRSAPSRRPGRAQRSDSGAWQRARRVALLAAAIALIPGVVSYARMLAQRSDSSVGIRTVEWLRDNGARGLVNDVESIYYSLNAPAKGGPQLRALPAQAAVTAPTAVRHRTHFYRPRRIAPVIHPV
ncbi:MAG: hypothetical protein JO372_04565, partial [Solirubrobacterales bacterium]|nr:hypothetical protein [Solirubrobacterales bacterium]